MKITFINSGVLVTAARSIGELSEKALSILEDRWDIDLDRDSSNNPL